VPQSLPSWTVLQECSQMRTSTVSIGARERHDGELDTRTILWRRSSSDDGYCKAAVCTTIPAADERSTSPFSEPAVACTPRRVAFQLVPLQTDSDRDRLRPRDVGSRTNNGRQPGPQRRALLPLNDPAGRSVRPDSCASSGTRTSSMIERSRGLVTGVGWYPV
jgi:hypothetical protein